VPQPRRLITLTANFMLLCLENGRHSAHHCDDRALSSILAFESRHGSWRCSFRSTSTLMTRPSEAEIVHGKNGKARKGNPGFRADERLPGVDLQRMILSWQSSDSRSRRAPLCGPGAEHCSQPSHRPVNPFFRERPYVPWTVDSSDQSAGGCRRGEMVQAGRLIRGRGLEIPSPSAGSPLAATALNDNK
jgi:hypothetical protein